MGEEMHQKSILSRAPSGTEEEKMITDLDSNRMDALVAAVQGKVRIALHGTNGFKPELVQQLVAAGVSKINVNKLVLDDYLDHLAATAGKVPQTVLMEQGTEKVISLTAEWMRHCGSAGKA